MSSGRLGIKSAGASARGARGRDTVLFFPLHPPSHLPPITWRRPRQVPVGVVMLKGTTTTTTTTTTKATTTRKKMRVLQTAAKASRAPAPEAAAAPTRKTRSHPPRMPQSQGATTTTNQSLRCGVVDDPQKITKKHRKAYLKRFCRHTKRSNPRLYHPRRTSFQRRGCLQSPSFATCTPSMYTFYTDDRVQRLQSSQSCGC